MRILKKQLPLNLHLLLLVLAALVPLFIFSAMIIDELVSREIANSERQIRYAAMDLARSFDQEIETSIRTLYALGVSKSFQDGNLKAFHKELARSLKTQPSWATILLHKSPETPILAAQRDFADLLEPSAEPESIAQVFSSKKPVVSPVVRVTTGMKSILSDRAGFGVRVPVFQGDKIYVLSAIISTDKLEKLVQTDEERWTRVLVDHTGKFAARSRSPNEIVGTPVPEKYRDKVLIENEFSSKDKSIEGNLLYAYSVRAPVSKWLASAAITATELEAPASQTRWIFSLGGLLILVIIAIVVLFYSNALAKPIGAVTTAAADLAVGKVPSTPPSSVKEVEKLRNSLVRTAELLQSKDHAKNEFLANMSHELRTPLGVVLGTNELISSSLTVSDEVRQHLDVMKRNGQQLLRLIDDILDLSQIEVNKLPIEKSKIQFSKFISDIVSDSQDQASKKGIELSLKIDDNFPSVIISDPARLRQVIQNIIGNSIKYTHKGFIQVTAKTSNSLIYIIVKDSGIGVLPEKRNIIFTPFNQGDGSFSRKYGGMGLGLSLAKKIAQNLGGDVKLIESELNVGSTFEISIALDTPKESSERHRGPKTEKINDKSLGNLEILLVEDSPDHRLLIETVLSRAGAQIDLATNGVEAIKSVKNKKYDAILMDLQMPIMDGYEAILKLRAEGCTIPIFALSAHALDVHKQKAKEAGFTDYITKPMEQAQLVAVIKKYLAHSKSEEVLNTQKNAD